MRIVILGASGLIGHKLLQQFQTRFDEVHGVLHGSAERFAHLDFMKRAPLHENIQGEDFDQVSHVLDTVKPDAVLNCLGITKRRPEVNDPLRAVAVNSLLPHRLGAWARQNGSRVIHFSTDCVFDGTEGNYTEGSVTTARDAYGQTKALGETRDDHNLTIRSSFIGRELAVHSELLDWFLKQNGKSIKGYSRAMYTGISTLEMARIIGDIVEKHTDLSGLYQLSMAEPIDKYSLLLLFRDAFGLDVEIEPDDTVAIDARLDGSRLRSEIGYELPEWRDMVQAIAADPTPYPTLS